MFRGLFGVPYVRTKNKYSTAMLDLAEIKANQTLIDFGSGDGSILINAAKNYGANGIGYEHLWILVQWAKIRANFSCKNKQIKFIRGNFLKDKKLPEADVISIYLFPEVNTALEPLLRRDYPRGTKVVSRTFLFPTLNLLKTAKAGKDTIYLYEI